MKYYQTAFYYYSKYADVVVENGTFSLIISSHQRLTNQCQGNINIYYLDRNILIQDNSIGKILRNKNTYLKGLS